MKSKMKLNAEFWKDFFHFNLQPRPTIVPKKKMAPITAQAVLNNVPYKAIHRAGLSKS